MRGLVMVAAAALLLGGCETISEEACLGGSWQDIGFQDGENGSSRSRFAQITETCAKYGVSPDRTLYFTGYETGLVRYCTPTKGYDAGARGSEAHSECRAGGFTDYMDAHAEGYAYYALVSERNTMVDQWNAWNSSVIDIESRLETEELTDSQRDALLKERAAIQSDMDELRVDIRVFERLNGLDEWSPY